MSTNNLLFLLIVFSLYNPERKYAEGALKGNKQCHDVGIAIATFIRHGRARGEIF